MRDWVDSDDGSGGGDFHDSGSFRSSATSHSGSGRSTKNDDGDPTGADNDGEGEYENDEFDDYESDSFEVDDNDMKAADADPEHDADPSAAWSTGRVQVFWSDEGAWFDGVVSDRSGHEFQVHYDDGDVAWEVRCGSNSEADSSFYPLNIASTCREERRRHPVASVDVRYRAVQATAVTIAVFFTTDRVGGQTSPRKSGRSLLNERGGVVLRPHLCARAQSERAAGQV